MAMQTGLEGKPWYVGAGVGALLAAALVAAAWYCHDRTAATRRSQARDAPARRSSRARSRKAARRSRSCRSSARRCGGSSSSSTSCCASCRRGATRRSCCGGSAQLTEQGDFDLLRFTPGNFIDKDFYSEWPIAIRLNGTYHNLALFFDRIGRFSRIINIENLKVERAARSSAKGHTISATFTAKTFVYRETPPPDPAAQAGKGKKPAGEAGGSLTMREGTRR